MTKPDSFFVIAGIVGTVHVQPVTHGPDGSTEVDRDASRARVVPHHWSVLGEVFHGTPTNNNPLSPWSWMLGMPPAPFVEKAMKEAVAYLSDSSPQHWKIGSVSMVGMMCLSSCPDNASPAFTIDLRSKEDATNGNEP